jgi:exodeoxyribonuclease VII large subunit
LRSPWTVTQITQLIKQTLDNEPELRDVWMQGEVSNWFRSRAGHCYFTMKDGGATIRAVMWRSTVERLTSVPQEGESLLAHGYISVYEPQGQYQFYVDTVTATGIGVLYVRFEELKARLAAEGLFAAERKRPLPPFPLCIGVVSSAESAAFRDICHVIGRRWPLVHILLSPTLVQGEQAPAQIVAALKALYRLPDLDLIIVARGGGSIEDLCAFNDEQVARVLAQSPIPVITGVGHETDYTIVGFVADRRAPTPSAAAEVAVPDRAQVEAQIALWADALTEAVGRDLDGRQRELDRVVQALRRLSPQMTIGRERQRTDELRIRLELAWQNRALLLHEQLQGTWNRLRSVDPMATLRRGYAVVRRQDGQIVHSTADVRAGDDLSVRVSDGSFPAVVAGEETRPAE